MDIRKSVSKRFVVTSLIVVLVVSTLAWLSFAPAGAPGNMVKRFISYTTGLCSSCKKQELDSSSPYVKSMSGQPLEQTLEAKAKAFAEANHIQVVEADGLFTYIIHAGGEPHKLFNTPSTEDGLKAAQSLLDRVIADKIAEMAKEPLRAAFAVENELVESQKVILKTNAAAETKTILARRPRLDELYGVEAALKRSRPSHMAPGNKMGVKFYFLREPLYKEEIGYAYYTTDKDSLKAIYVTPGATDKIRATEADAPIWALPSRFTPGHYFDTIESLILHELAHNHQERMGWEQEGSSILQKMTDDFGFVKTVDADNVRLFLIKVKTDKADIGSVIPASAPLPPEGSASAATAAAPTGPAYDLYRVERPVNSEKGKRWLRVNDKLQYLDENGQVVDKADKAKSLTNSQVRQSALIQMPSDYFDTPIEVFAEGMRMYRMGGDARAALDKDAPFVAKIVKEQDQAEINLASGYIKIVEKRTMVKNGTVTILDDITYDQPMAVRNDDGQLVPFTPVR